MSQTKIVKVTEDELKLLVKEATKEAVSETLLALGIDTQKPLETQADFIFIRKMRLASDAVARQGVLTVIGLIVTGLCAAAWVGIRTAMTTHGGGP